MSILKKGAIGAAALAMSLGVVAPNAGAFTRYGTFNCPRGIGTATSGGNYQSHYVNGVTVTRYWPSMQVLWNATRGNWSVTSNGWYYAAWCR